MSSVRRISLVGRHKRSKSAPVLGDVLPSPSIAFFRNPNAGQEPVPPVPYSLPPLPGPASASTSQLSLKLPSSSSALNLPVPVNPKKSTTGRRIVSNSSQNSSVQPPSTASSVSRSSTHQGRASENGKKRPSISGGRRSLDLDLKLYYFKQVYSASQCTTTISTNSSPTTYRAAPAFAAKHDKTGIGTRALEIGFSTNQKSQPARSQQRCSSF
ncbi:hypothetical protein CPC08DRAFT_766829 [Agrocybe pediades]|nr:hypothetical protein CPC08DRAFT_766829 [Agrocybe pediades]